MQRISTSLVQLTCLELNKTGTRTGDQRYSSVFRLEALAPLCSLPHLRKLGTDMLHCYDLSSMSKLPITYIRIPRFSSDTDNAHFSAWLRSSGHSLETMLIYVPGAPSRMAKISVEAATCAPKLRTLEMAGVSLCIAELALLTQLSRLELVVCDLRDADLCTSLAMPNLRSLRLCYARAVQRVHVFVLFLAVGLPQLTDLCVDNSTAVGMAEAGFKDRIVGLQQQYGTKEQVYTLLPAAFPGHGKV